eukprot:1155397-Pelagomonas_calceolata.AAC.5
MGNVSTLLERCKKPQRVLTQKMLRPPNLTHFPAVAHFNSSLLLCWRGAFSQGAHPEMLRAPNMTFFQLRFTLQMQAPSARNLSIEMLVAAQPRCICQSHMQTQPHTATSCSPLFPSNASF